MIQISKPFTRPSKYSRGKCFMKINCWFSFILFYLFMFLSSILRRHWIVIISSLSGYLFVIGIMLVGVYRLIRIRLKNGKSVTYISYYTKPYHVRNNR